MTTMSLLAVLIGIAVGAALGFLYARSREATATADLAARAKENLSRYPNVTVHAASGVEFDPGPCDAMLINAGVTIPLPTWLDRLGEGGRMMVPLTIAMGPSLGKGMIVKITREGNGFAAHSIGFVMIYSCASARDPQMELSLGKALTTGALLKMTCVRRDHHEPDDTCIVHGPRVCLSCSATPRHSD